MGQQLDIGPLRSFVAVAESGGFQRAADRLHLSQAGVSQHVRRLEAAVGRPLVERHGRGSRFTPAGEWLLERARAILALHDETLRGLDVHRREVVVGTTEHAAAQLLPTLSDAFASSSAFQLRYRIDRGARLRDGLAARQVDVALLLNITDDELAVPVGELDLTWYAAPSWRAPTGPDPTPVVAFDSPCELRRRALETLSAHGIPAQIGAEANQLAGVQAAVGAGLGVALLATRGETPRGLVVCEDLPVAEPLTLFVCPGPDADRDVVQAVVEILREALARPPLLALAQ